MTYIIHYSYPSDCDRWNLEEESIRKETEEEVQKFIDETEAYNKEPRYQKIHTTIDLIEYVGDIINVTHKFTPNQAAVEAIIEQTRKEKIEREAQRQQKETEQRRKEYLKLKKEFESES